MYAAAGIADRVQAGVWLRSGRTDRRHGQGTVTGVARLRGVGAGAVGVDDEGRRGDDVGLAVGWVVDHAQARGAPFGGDVEHPITAVGAVAVLDVGIFTHNRVGCALRAPAR